jgi:agmatine deiminase
LTWRAVSRERSGDRSKERVTMTMAQTKERRGTTPRADGLRLPARFVEHRATLLSWPCRADLFGPLFEAAKTEWAEVATTIARYEPVIVLARPGDEAEAKRQCGANVEVLAVPMDDSWIRDNGPIFVRDRGGRVALVHFGFDGWDREFEPYGQDAAVPRRVAEAWGVRRYEAPFVLEGGAFNTDGEGTILTTEQCLLYRRNYGLTRRQNEELLREWLGIEQVVWLPYGLLEDTGRFTTNGHVDDVAQFAAPGVVVAQTCPPDNPNHARLQANLGALRAARDAEGRRLEVVELPVLPYVTGVGAGLEGVTGPGADHLMPAPYVNMVFAHGALLVPKLGWAGEDEAHALLAGLFPDRELAGLPTELQAFGGGGLGCITQQVPAGEFLS